MKSRRTPAVREVGVGARRGCPTFDERSGTVTKEAMDKFLDFAFADECEVRAFLRKFIYKK